MTLIPARLTRRKTLSRVIFLPLDFCMRIEPDIKRTIAFVDGQNLFNHAKAAFGYNFPNYDIKLLAEAVCRANGWSLRKIHFYTGIPELNRDQPRHAFWANKFRAMKNQGIDVYPRALVYRQKTVDVPNFGPYTFDYSQEKGIDVRLALDALSAAVNNELDVALVFSQDQDSSELASLIRTVSVTEDRWMRIASAFPESPTASSHRGIAGTYAYPFNKAFYDACIDPRDYRPRP